MLGKRFALALLLGGAALPAAARDLPVPDGKGWQHAATGLILTASLDGLPRTKLSDLTETEHDVVAEFATADASIVATVYIFRPALDDVAVWFDRSATMIEKRDVYGGAIPLHPAPLSFAPFAGNVSSALRQAYTPGKPPYRSTALAIMPLGEWLVKVRLSAVDLDAMGVDARLSRIIAALRWPKTIAPATAAVPIATCAVPLAYQKAKTVKADMGDLLIASVISGGIGSSETGEAARQATPTTWCRDGEAGLPFGTYRRVDGGQSYSLAIGDAGRAGHVAPSLMAVLGSGPVHYTVTFANLDGATSTYASFDRLPKPEQAFDLIRKGAPLSRTTGNNITLDSGAFKN